MKLQPIITSLLDIDLYKFNMNQVVFHKYSNLNGEYYFKCRNEKTIFSNEMLEEINKQIDDLCNLKFTMEELEYLKNIKFLKEDYIEYLKIWRPKREYIKTKLNKGKLEVKISGPLVEIMKFEIYLLSIINEVYFRLKYNYEDLLNSANKKLDEKIKKFKKGIYNFEFIEFGTRRRLSKEWQEFLILKISKEIEEMIGTSNVFLAKKYNLKVMGTFGHEYVQMFQGIEEIPLEYTNYYALKEWYEEYRGENGIALTDTLTTDLFLKDFDKEMMKCYKGVRHDSGDPYIWADKILNHYEKNSIDTKDKILLFSDSLNFEKSEKIYEKYKEKSRVLFGIGTFLTNDTCVESLNIVIKLNYVNGKSVMKLSDTEGKRVYNEKKKLENLLKKN